jgi:sugar/nucleoside kinase (ribokinase family)
LVLVFGTICLDRIRQVPFLPGPGGYVETLTEAALLGGEAANTAFALQTWGAKILLAGNSLGAGEEGELLERMLIKHSLSMQHLKRGAVEAPVCDIYVTPDGERTMFGKGFRRMKETVDPVTVPYQPGDWFTAEPNMGDAARETARLAAGAGMKVYLMDFIGDDEPLGPGSFWQSSTDWAGERGDVTQNIGWLQAWVERYGCFGILSDGLRGFVAGSSEESVRAYPAYPAPVTVDTTGAGDMFRAGVLYGLDQGWEIGKCLQFGAAAGSLKCRGVGGTGYVPPVIEVHEHIARYPEISAEY